MPLPLPWRDIVPIFTFITDLLHCRGRVVKLQAFSLERRLLPYFDRIADTHNRYYLFIFGQFSNLPSVSLGVWASVVLHWRLLAHMSALEVTGRDASIPEVEVNLDITLTSKNSITLVTSLKPGRGLGPKQL